MCSDLIAERLHVKFCKYVSEVSRRSTNIAIAGELGRYPLWERPKKDFLNHFLEVILQKPCNTHRHEYLEKLINNKCKT